MYCATVQLYNTNAHVSRHFAQKRKTKKPYKKAFFVSLVYVKEATAKVHRLHMLYPMRYAIRLGEL